eukprot:516642-Prymnesium_polylepis.1
MSKRVPRGVRLGGTGQTNRMQASIRPIDLKAAPEGKAPIDLKGKSPSPRSKHQSVDFAPSKGTSGSPRKSRPQSAPITGRPESRRVIPADLTGHRTAALLAYSLPHSTITSDGQPIIEGDPSRALQRA